MTLLTCLLASGPLGAQGADDPGDEPPPTFAYTTHAEPHALRAMLEAGSVLVFGFAWYATTSRDTVRDWDVGYRFATFRRKITGDAFGPDTNRFGTNFVGHTLGGTSYYLAARSNRLSVPQSFAFAVAGSLLWELFGEVSEIVSLNDTVVTPLGGLAVGEAMTQLAGFFDRSAPTASNRALGAIFGPLKTLNDRFDNLEPSRTPRGFAAGEWHRFDLEAGFQIARAEAGRTDGRHAWHPEARFLASSELARLPGYTRAGGASFAFDDGNRSSMSLGVALGASGVSDLAFRSHVVLAGFYYRARVRDANGSAWGGNGIIGVGTGFQYTLHDFERGEPGGVDRLAAVEPVGFFFEQRGALGGPELATRITAGPSFGGVTPLAVDEYRGSPTRLPPVQRRHDYYFGLGGHVTASVELEAGGIEARGAARAEVHRAVGGPGEDPYVRMEDARAELSATLGYRVPETVAKPALFALRRARFGRVGQARSATEEIALGASLAAVF